jgi:acetyl-CoA carboxylase biotin carboxyl carrier protein
LLDKHHSQSRTRITYLTGGLVDLKDIKAVIDLMKKNAISEFELEKQDFKIRLKRAIGATATVVDDTVSPLTSPATNLAVIQSPSTSSAVAAVPPASTGVEIKAPMIGTFYRAPSPESAQYVEVGTEVNPDTVVCIIEAMKVMNEIKAEMRGVVTKVLVDNAKPVEFGQPMFKVRPL